MMMRKHKRQMTRNEIEFVNSVLARFRTFDAMRKLRLSTHCLQEMVDDKLGKIRVEDIVRTILFGSFFEVNNFGNSFRIVLRHNTCRRFSTIVVLDVINCTIVTCYRNRATDNHRTIRWNKYRWKVNIKEVLVK